MQGKHLAQCLVHNPCSRNVLNKHKWKADRGQGWRDGRMEELIQLAYFIPLHLCFGNNPSLDHFPARLCWRPWCGLLGQTSVPTAKSRGQGEARSSWACGTERNRGSSPRNTSAHTLEGLFCSWPISSQIGWEATGRNRESLASPQGDSVPDKLYFYDKVHVTERPGSQRCGLGL